MNNQFDRALYYLSLSAGIAFPLGFLVADWLGWAIFSSALFVQLAFHLQNLARLERWTKAPNVDATLTGKGLWGRVFSRIYRHEKEMHAEVLRSKHEVDMFVAAAEALTDGVIVLDQQYRILFLNSIAEAQFGLSIEKDRGQLVMDLIREPDFANHMHAANFTEPLTLCSKRKIDHVFSIRVIPYSKRYLLQTKDVTQTILLERMRRDFVANVSHELRTPLTVLSGFLEIFREMNAENAHVENAQMLEQERYLSLMSDQTQRMQSIVQDLLTLSSIESAPPPENSRIDMATILERLVIEATTLSDGKHQIEIDVNDACDLNGAESELLSAFTNLVSNAVRYTPNGGKISLAWRVNDLHGQQADKNRPKEAVFSVKDSGIGIDNAHIPRLTERFYRVDRGRSRQVGGTGLGLAIVKHALNRHQARLHIQSAPDYGSTFSAHFPPERLLPRENLL